MMIYMLIGCGNDDDDVRRFSAFLLAQWLI